MHHVSDRRRLLVVVLVALVALVASAVALTPADPFAPEGRSMRGGASAPTPTTQVVAAPGAVATSPAMAVQPTPTAETETETEVAPSAASLSRVAAAPRSTGGPQAALVPPSAVIARPDVERPSPSVVAVSPLSAPTSSTFGIGTLNVLGSQHRPGGTARASALAGAIEERDVDLVGLQEVQSDQLAVLEAGLADHAFWPARALGSQGLRLQIVYRRSLFELVDAGWITTVFDHLQRPVPWVELRERSSGRSFYAVDLHNSPGVQSADRHAAITEEIALVLRLRATGLPVLVVGDFNDRTTSACRLAAAGDLVGSNGLSNLGGCRAGSGPQRIDHVLGGPGVRLTDHVVDDSPPVSTATDHSFVRARAMLTSGSAAN